jgi:hypothetical protein
MEFFMITKFECIPGKNLATLMSFIHSEENWVINPEVRTMIVSIKAISPHNVASSFTEHYGLTLELLEWFPLREDTQLSLRQERVDSKYLMKVYEILGQNRRTEVFHE